MTYILEGSSRLDITLPKGFTMTSCNFNNQGANHMGAFLNPIGYDPTSTGIRLFQRDGQIGDNISCTIFCKKH